VNELVEIRLADRWVSAQDDVAEIEAATALTRSRGLRKKIETYRTLNVVHRGADDDIQMSGDGDGEKFCNGVDKPSGTLNPNGIRTLTGNVPESDWTFGALLPIGSHARKSA